ncbi:hypothetical protein [Pectobacterium brasiliense]|uniref:hypothetical protein n=1 Tax=Pectobacterium brasiliense TaxID=180957 RepID=UPI0011AFFF3C|nr:hypothetical protein [Pectobacterium brasiliense]
MKFMFTYRVDNHFLEDCSVMVLKPSKEVRVPIYGVRVAICANAEIASAKYGEDFLNDNFAAQVSVVKCIKSGILMVAICYREPNEYNAETLTHECVHAAWRILELVGITVSVDNQEPLAYLAGWLSRQVNNFMMDHIEAQKKSEETK